MTEGQLQQFVDIFKSTIEDDVSYLNKGFSKVDTDIINSSIISIYNHLEKILRNNNLFNEDIEKNCYSHQNYLTNKIIGLAEDKNSYDYQPISEHLAEHIFTEIFSGDFN